MKAREQDKRSQEYIAIIMGGGKATRFDFAALETLDIKEIKEFHEENLFLGPIKEKLLLPINGNPIFYRVFRALLESKIFSELYITLSKKRNFQTKQWIEEQKTKDPSLNNLKIIETSGKGYHNDQKEVLESFNKTKVLWFISGDLAFLTSDVIHEIHSQYNSLNHPPSLLTAAPLHYYEKYTIEPTYTFNFKGIELVPLGINIIQVFYRDYEYIPQEICIMNKPQLVFNINTIANYLKAIEYSKEKQD